MLEIKLSPEQNGKFKLPLIADAKVWLQSDFKNRTIRLHESTPPHFLFSKADLSKIFAQPGCDRCVFTKVKVLNQNNSDSFSLAATGATNANDLQLDSNHKIFAGNRIDNLLPDGNVTSNHFIESTPIVISPELSNELKYERFEIMDVRGNTLQKKMKAWQKFDSFQDVNYFMQVIFKEEDFSGFFSSPDCHFIAAFPVTMRSHFTRKTEEEVEGEKITEQYNMLIETLALTPLKESGEVLATQKTLISPNAWPPRYIALS